MKKTFFILLILILLFSGHKAVHAYVLKGPHIMELMLQHQGVAHQLMVSQRVVMYGNGADNEGSEFNETVKYKFPDKFRSDINGENIDRIHVVSGESSIIIIDHKFVRETESKFDIYKDIFLYRSTQLLNQKLIHLGIDTSVSGFGRFLKKGIDNSDSKVENLLKRIVYIVGAEYHDESVSQIWFDKDTFKPVRWIIVQKGEDSFQNVLDIRYMEWKSVKRFWYPTKIEFYENDNLVREINVDKIKVDPLLAEDLFNIEYMKSTYINSTSEELQQDESKEIQETVDDFQRIYE